MVWKRNGDRKTRTQTHSPKTVALNIHSKCLRKTQWNKTSIQPAFNRYRKINSEKYRKELNWRKANGTHTYHITQHSYRYKKKKKKYPWNCCAYFRLYFIRFIHSVHRTHMSLFHMFTSGTINSSIRLASFCCCCWLCRCCLSHIVSYWAKGSETATIKIRPQANLYVSTSIFCTGTHFIIFIIIPVYFELFTYFTIYFLCSLICSPLISTANYSINILSTCRDELDK